MIARERDLSILSLVCRANTGNISSRIPECPVRLNGVEETGLMSDIFQVCFERFRGQSEVHQCERGHFVCGNCRPRVEVREERDLYKTYLGIFQVCPTCRGRMIGRCHGFEQFLQSLNV